MISIIYKAASLIILSIAMLMLLVLFCFSGAPELLLLLPIVITIFTAIYCFAKFYFYKLHGVQLSDAGTAPAIRLAALKYLQKEGIIPANEAMAMKAEIEKISNS